MPASMNLPPKQDGHKQGKVMTKITLSHARRVRLKPTLDDFTVLWVNINGIPFNTSGFTAVASTTSGRILQTVRFDAFGVAVFTRINTPTRRVIIIRTFRNGLLFRTRRVIAGVAAFAIIG